MGRVAIGLVATLALVVLMLAVDRDSLAILPALLPAVWLPLFVGERRDPRRSRGLMLVLVAGLALLALGLVVA
jgi:hypothetical protein